MVTFSDVVRLRDVTFKGLTTAKLVVLAAVKGNMCSKHEQPLSKAEIEEQWETKSRKVEGLASQVFLFCFFTLPVHSER